MKVLYKYIHGYEKESILAPLFKLLEVVFDLMVPLVVAKIIDVGIVNSDTGYIVKMFIALIVMAMLGLASSITAQFFAAKASVGFATKLRQALFDHIQSFSFTELDTLKTDTLITRLTDDVNQVQNGYNMALRLLLRSPFVVLGSMIMAFTINVQCALVFVVAIPILFVVVFTIMIVSIPLFKKVQSALDKITGLTRENLTGVRVIRAFCQEENSIEQFDNQNEYLTKMNLFVGRISALLNPLTYVLINIATIILIQKAGLQVNIGNMQQGEVVALYNYMAQMIVELIKLASLIITLNKAMACADRVSSVLKVETSMKYEEKEEKTLDSTVVSFKNVSFTYAGAATSSLENISFDVLPGQTIGIIGPTGSGKSTLVRLIARFYDATHGEIFVSGKNVKDYSKKSLMDKIGYVFQRSVLFQGSIRDNLMLGNETATDEELWKALELAQAKEVVESKKGQLDFELEQGGRNLSGGQKQRLTIARALVKKPEILILDDSASALDFATDAKLRQAIRTLKGHTTTFLVSQRTASIKQSDLILVMDDGKLVGKGSHDELMETCSVYQEIYYSQFPKKEVA
jgi:ATP-binding cassette, subfamily B, multidrug efflux pump